MHRDCEGYVVGVRTIFVKLSSTEQGSNDYHSSEAGPVNQSGSVNTESDSESRTNSGEDTEDTGCRLCEGAGENVTVCASL